MDNNFLNDNIWYIVAIVNSALAGILAKYYVLTNNILYLYIAILCNVFNIFAYVQIFNDASMSTGYAFIKVMAILLVAMVGFIFLEETCTLRSVIGIIFGMLAIYFLSCKN